MEAANSPASSPSLPAMRSLVVSAAIRGAITPLVFEIARFVRSSFGDVAGYLTPPLLTALLFFPLFLRLVRAGSPLRAVSCSVVWALSCSLVSIVLFRATGDRYLDVVWNAEKYRREMFTWVATGMGEESDPSRFIPQHGRHFLAFAVLSFASVGFLALALGAALLHYMNFYVGSLASTALHPVATALLGWPPYAIVRVVGFITVAVALTGLALHRFFGVAVAPVVVRRALILGLALVLLDILIKSLVAPAWGRMLHGLVFP